MTQPQTGPPPQTRKRKPFDIIAFLRSRILLILGLGTVISATLAPVFRLLMKSHYEAKGALLVDVSKEITLTGREREIVPTNVGDYVRTLVNRVGNLDVLNEALQSLPPELWPCFCDPQAPAARNAVAIFKNLTVKEEVHSFLITTSLRGEKAQGLGTTLNAVMEKFLEKLRDEQVQNTSLRLTYLQAERARIEERVLAQRKRLLDLSAKVPNKAFLQGNYSVHLVNLEQIQKLYWEAEADRAIKEGLWHKTKSDEEKMGSLSLSPYAEERVANNEGINRIEQWTYEQLQTLRTHIDGLTANNKDRQYVEERMAAMKAYLEGHKKRVNETTSSFLAQKRAYDLRADVIKAASAHEASREARNELSRQLEEAKHEASDTAEAIFNAADISYNVSQLRDRLSSLNTRIDDCEMEAKSPIKLFIDRRASDPTRPAQSAGAKALIASLIAGFGCIGGVCLCFELADGRVRSRSHVEGALHGPSPTPVPNSETLEGSPFWRITRTSPDSIAALSLRSLAVRLERERKLHGGRVFLVAGAGHGVGATSIALSLADTLSTFVPRVLFVEVSPSTSPNGVSLRNEAENLSLTLGDIEGWMARKADRNGLSLLANHDPGVPLPAQIRHLLSQARETFDIAVINTPPPGFHDFAQFILLEVDAAVVVVGEDKTLYKELVATFEVLRERPVAALTAILNFSTSHKAFDRAFLTDKYITGVSRFCTSFRKRIHGRLPWSR